MHKMKGGRGYRGSEIEKKDARGPERLIQPEKIPVGEYKSERSEGMRQLIPTRQEGGGSL